MQQIETTFDQFIRNKQLLNTFTIKKIPPLFPRIEEQQLLETSTQKSETVKEEKKVKMEENKKQNDNESGANLITIDQFFQTQLKVGTVVEAEEVPKSKKLLKLQVDLGEEKPRQIIAGIKEWYSPDDLKGSQVCVVANLKPAKLMGMLSEGMLLAAKDDDGLCLIRPEKSRKPGSSIG